MVAGCGLPSSGALTEVADRRLMVGQAGMDIDRYWSKFFTDIPFVLILALGIYLLRPTADSHRSLPDERVQTVAQHDS